MALARLRLAPELARASSQRSACGRLQSSSPPGRRASWAPALGQEAPVAALPPLFALAFDSIQSELVPLISATARPSSDPIRVRLAGLSILVAGMIGRIGAQTLEALVGSRQFSTWRRLSTSARRSPRLCWPRSTKRCPLPRPPLPRRSARPTGYGHMTVSTTPSARRSRTGLPPSPA